MDQSNYNAIVSGRAGLALLSTGDAVFALRPGSTSLQQHSPEEVSWLLGGSRDLELVEEATVEDIAANLDLAINREEALQLALILLSREYADPPDLRAGAAEELSQAFQATAVREAVDNVLYSVPLPASADVSGAIATAAPYQAVPDWLNDLQRHQPAIREVHSSWQLVADSLTAADPSIETVDAAFVRAGVFREFVVALVAGHDLNQCQFRLLMSSVLKTRLPHALVRRLLADFKKSLSSTQANVPFDSQKSESTNSDWDESNNESVIRGFNRQRLGAQAQEQVARIAEQVRGGNVTQARRWVADLVNWHLRHHEGSKYACKSLCNLAKQLQDFGAHEFQQEVMERAVELEGRDAQTWCQLGHARLMNRDFDAALEAYDRAVLLDPSDVVSRCGRAEVLKAQGHFDEALVAYDEAIAIDARNVVSRSGRAEVLKARGHFDEALVAYDEAIAMDARNVVSRSGRAEVLKAQGHFDEALVAYDEAIAMDAGDVVSRSGRAEVLKAQGRFDEALVAYDEAIAMDSRNVVSRSGRAEVLKAQGRFDEALVAYDEALKLAPFNRISRNGRAVVLAELGRIEEAQELVEIQNPQTYSDWVARHIFGMLLVRQMRFEEAEVVFETGLKSCPFWRQQEYFRSALVSLRLRRREFDLAAGLLQAVKAPETTVLIRPLQIQLLGLQQQAALAAAEFDALLETRVVLDPEFRDELRDRFVLLKPGRHDDDWMAIQQIRFQMRFINLSAT